LEELYVVLKVGNENDGEWGEELHLLVLVKETEIYGIIRKTQCSWFNHLPLSLMSYDVV
jgi:hypothetical protein